MPDRPVSSAAKRYDAYMAAFVGYHAAHPYQREGQAHFNVLYLLEPDFADLIRGGPLDPFHSNGVLPAYFDALRSHWNV